MAELPPEWERYGAEEKKVRLRPKLYDDLLREAYNSDGCEVGAGASPTRTCME